MKKLFVVTIVLFSILSAKAQNVDVFVKGGIGLSNWIGKDSEGTDAKFSYRIGMGVDVPIRNIWGFRTGLNLANIGTQMKITDEDLSAGWAIKAISKTNQLYLELPILATASFDITDKVGCTVGTGPYFAVGVGGKTKSEITLSDGTVLSDKATTFHDTEDTESLLNRFDAGIGIDVEFEIKHIIFGIDTRFGLYKFYRDDFFGEVEKYKCYNFSTCLVVGYRF